MAKQKMRVSTALISSGVLLLVLAVALFGFGLWVQSGGTSGTTTPDFMTRIGQVAGGLGGIGMVLALIGWMKRGKEA